MHWLRAVLLDERERCGRGGCRGAPGYREECQRQSALIAKAAADPTTDEAAMNRALAHFPVVSTVPVNSYSTISLIRRDNGTVDARLTLSYSRCRGYANYSEVLRGQPLRVATATAMTECVIARVERPTCLQTLRDEPTFSELFTSYLLARTVRVEEDLVDQLFNSSEKRLARTLPG